jgi:hypothetical protein
MENGLVRLSGSGKEVLEHPEIGALYLGGAVTGEAANGAGRESEDGNGAVNGTASRAGR